MARVPIYDHFSLFLVAQQAGLAEALCEHVAWGSREVCRAVLAGASDVDVLVVAQHDTCFALNIFVSWVSISLFSEIFFLAFLLPLLA